MAELSEVRTEEHKMAYFQCQVNKDDVTVTWLKDNQPLTPSNKHIMEQDGRSHTLIIKDVDQGDVAEYSVVVGDRKSSARLHLDGEFFVWCWSLYPSACWEILLMPDLVFFTVCFICLILILDWIEMSRFFRTLIIFFNFFGNSFSLIFFSPICADCFTLHHFCVCVCFLSLFVFLARKNLWYFETIQRRKCLWKLRIIVQRLLAFFFLFILLLFAKWTKLVLFFNNVNILFVSHLWLISAWFYFFIFNHVEWVDNKHVTCTLCLSACFIYHCNVLFSSHSVQAVLKCLRCLSYSCIPLHLLKQFVMGVVIVLHCAW